MVTYRTIYRYVYICKHMNTYIFLLSQPRDASSNNAPVAMSTSSGQMLVSNMIPH